MKTFGIRQVTVQRAKINRCRPVFNEWKADVELMYDGFSGAEKQTCRVAECSWSTVMALVIGVHRYGRLLCQGLR